MPILNMKRIVLLLAQSHERKVSIEKMVLKSASNVTLLGSQIKNNRARLSEIFSVNTPVRRQVDRSQFDNPQRYFPLRNFRTSRTQHYNNNRTRNLQNGPPPNHQNSPRKNYQNGPLPNYQHGSPPNFQYGPPWSYQYRPPPNHQNGSPQVYQNPQHFQNGPPPNHRNGPQSNYQNNRPRYLTNSQPQNYHNNRPNGLPQNYQIGPPLDNRNGPPLYYQNGPPPNYQNGPRPNYQNNQPLDYQNNSPRDLRQGDGAFDAGKLSFSIPPRIKDLLEHGKHETPEVHREPYLHQGDWVFKRTTAKFTIGPGIKTVRPQEWPDPGEGNQCDVDCPTIYWKIYGTVCGIKQSLNDNQTQWKEFNNICEMDFENCRHPESLWRLMHRGECPELYAKSGMYWNDSPAGVADADGFRSRAVFWLSQTYPTPVTRNSAAKKL